MFRAFCYTSGHTVRVSITGDGHFHFLVWSHRSREKKRRYKFVQLTTKSE